MLGETDGTRQAYCYHLAQARYLETERWRRWDNWVLDVFLPLVPAGVDVADVRDLGFWVRGPNGASAALSVCDRKNDLEQDDPGTTLLVQVFQWPEPVDGIDDFEADDSEDTKSRVQALLQWVATAHDPDAMDIPF